VVPELYAGFAGWGGDREVTPKISDTKELYRLGAVPIDRVAWRVVQPGEHWETKDRVEVLTFDAPPIPPESRVQYGPGQKPPKDYTGTKFGRLTVWYYWRHKYNHRTVITNSARGQVRINSFNKASPYSGMQVIKSGARQHEWLCRCSCGLFCVRTGEQVKLAIREPHVVTPRMMCSHCFSLEVLRRNATPTEKWAMSRRQ
jgi:hypothetical protein